MPMSKGTGFSTVYPTMFAQQSIEPDTILRIGVGVVIRDERGWVLLEQRADCGWWGLPGGKLEVGESVTETAIREVKEETGLDIAIIRFVGIYSEPSLRIVTYPDTPGGVQLIDVVLEGNAYAGNLTCSHESLDLRYFSSETLPAELIPPSRIPLWDTFSETSARVR